MVPVLKKGNSLDYFSKTRRLNDEKHV